ncbi:hypothetical protein HSBGL_0133 [Halapricum desulfuricans]|uniref:Uncharacterized protein n=1 Tax=Halapricum desulfuricans TaxID=2841257 RepID=A0A897NDT4_9EURY|nr:hypothetical protein [Halapricum desulfuricans]QSG10574.1 hypothetical protein HSBGL_0133 [Halapricum desulfuricans]
MRPIHHSALHASAFGERSGLLGLFYRRADDDPETVEALPERYTAGEIAEKVVHDIEHWYEIDASVCRIADCIHRQGAVISWIVE